MQLELEFGLEAKELHLPVNLGTQCLVYVQSQRAQIVLDGGYNVPAGYAGRVLMGMGPGPYLGTHAKPVTHEYP